MNVRSLPLNLALAVQQPELFGREIGKLLADDPQALWFIVLSLDRAIANHYAAKLLEQPQKPDRWAKRHRMLAWT